MIINHLNLLKFTAQVFELAGCEPQEASIISKHLVEANLTGHDSHGIIRVSQYVEWIRAGKVYTNKKIKIIAQSDTFALLDGNFGFGQVIGEQAVAFGINLARKKGVAVIALRNSGHLGRIGDWAEMAIHENLISMHFVNSNGFAILAVPCGGTDRRLSSNPIAFGVPRGDKPPILLDMATCKFSEGKIMVAKNKGVELPEGIIVDGFGKPTCDPNVFYLNPPGAILPLSPDYKGYGLAIMCELLAGALTGGDTSSPASPSVSRMANGMLSIYIDQKRFGDTNKFLAEIDKLEAWVKASPPAVPNGEILLPGEPEHRTRQMRLKEGIPVDDETLRQLQTAAQSVGIKNFIV